MLRMGNQIRLTKRERDFMFRYAEEPVPEIKTVEQLNYWIDRRIAEIPTDSLECRVLRGVLERSKLK